MAKTITLYALSTCAYCQAIKSMFDTLNVGHLYIELDLLSGDERKNFMESLKKHNPKCSFPTTVIGKDVVVGYKIQEIKDILGLRTEVDTLIEKLAAINEKKGYFFNRDREHTYQLVRGLLTNKDRYGYMACPCRLASGQKEQDRDIFCPCVYREPDVNEFGSCYCGLYVSDAWNRGDIEHVDVPERRPIELM